MRRCLLFLLRLNSQIHSPSFPHARPGLFSSCPLQQWPSSHSVLLHPSPFFFFPQAFWSGARVSLKRLFLCPSRVSRLALVTLETHPLSFSPLLLHSLPLPSPHLLAVLATLPLPSFHLETPLCPRFLRPFTLFFLTFDMSPSDGAMSFPH